MAVEEMVTDEIPGEEAQEELVPAAFNDEDES